MQKVKPQVTTDQLAQKYPTYLTIDRGNFQLRLWKNLKLVQTYTIAVGQPGLETPAGDLHDRRQAGEPFLARARLGLGRDLAGQVIPPGPADPIKARWMGFFNGAGIHGTDEVVVARHRRLARLRADVDPRRDRRSTPRSRSGTPIYIGELTAQPRLHRQASRARRRTSPHD